MEPVLVSGQVEKEEDKSLPVYVLGHSMGSLVATVAAEKCQESAIVAPRFKKLVLSGKRAAALRLCKATSFWQRIKRQIGAMCKLVRPGLS